MRFIPEYKYRKLNGIYIIRNDIDDRIYIGECKNFYKRFGRHKSALNRNKHQNIKLQNFVNKYGIKTLSFDIIEIMNTDSSDELIEREMYYIQKYDSIKNGFNIILDSRSMDYITSEQRLSAGNKLKGMKRDTEFCKKVSEAVRSFYDTVPLEQRRRAKWTEERKTKRSEYIKSHPERYANRKPSPGNRTTREQGRKCASKINEQIAYLIKLSILENIPRKQILERYKVSVSLYKSIQAGKSWKHVKVGNYENKN